MLGTDFARTLRAAQAGEEEAFARLWRDANPTMIRYLRVVGHDDPYDEACEGWITVVRGLPGFSGDELAWRVWLLACARQRAEESTLRRAWGSVTVLPGVPFDADGELDIDELLEPDGTGAATQRGINETLAALRALPLGQGEVVVLHLGAGLPPTAVADVIGVDAANIERAETRALERLGTGADLLAWSLAAPATTAELADEHIALSAFRKIPVSARRADRVKIIAIGRGSGSATGPGGVSAGRRTNRIPGAAVGASAVGRSRTAILTATVLSVSAVSLGGLGAAAYAGVLPDKVQQVLHEVVGAPAPKVHGTGNGTGSGNGSSRHPATSKVTPPTAGVGPLAKPTKGSGPPTAHGAPSGRPSHPTKPSPTKTPNPHSPTTKGPNPHSTKSGQKVTNGKSATGSPTTAAPSGAGSTAGSHTPNARSTGKGPKSTSTDG